MVVGIIGKTVVWYNDIEEGFNRSKYTKYGKIGDYWCNQDELEWTIQHILNEIKDGHPGGYYSGPPEPIALPFAAPDSGQKAALSGEQYVGE